MFEIDIASFRNRRKSAEAEAIKAIAEGSYQLALLKLSDAMTYSAAENELQFQKEAIGYDRDDKS